jgi:hypothetical protein
MPQIYINYYFTTKWQKGITLILLGPKHKKIY